MKRIFFALAILISASFFNSYVHCADETISVSDFIYSDKNPITSDRDYRQSIYKLDTLIKQFDLEMITNVLIAHGIYDDINKAKSPIVLKDLNDSLRNKIYTVEPVTNQMSLVDLGVEYYRMGAGKAPVLLATGTTPVGVSLYDQLAKKIFKNILVAKKTQIPGKFSVHSFQDFIFNMTEYVIKKIPLPYRAELTSDIQQFLLQAKQKGKWSFTGGKYAIGGKNLPYLKEIVAHLQATPGFTSLTVPI